MMNSLYITSWIFSHGRDLSRRSALGMDNIFPSLGRLGGLHSSSGRAGMAAYDFFDLQMRHINLEGIVNKKGTENPISENRTHDLSVLDRERYQLYQILYHNV